MPTTADIDGLFTPLRAVRLTPAERRACWNGIGGMLASSPADRARDVPPACQGFAFAVWKGSNLFGCLQPFRLSVSPSRAS